ncbi:MAG: histidine phosphatase family protein, partial [Pseudomonadota bacterium]|nr:histidine phosphatase family protein [Pseudomonadota bacterium]
GREEAGGWRAPDELRDATWVSSPLRRAVETARLLGFEPETQEPLIETRWGDFEGLDRHQLHARIDELNLDPSLGIDFQPPGGESPRMVAERLGEWLKERARHSVPLVAVTHKGVIRAALSLATGWDMREDYPEKLRWDCAQRFHLGNNGEFSLAQLNIRLTAGTTSTRAGSCSPIW